MTRDEMIEKLEGLHAFIYSVSSHGEKEAHDTIRAVIAALRAPAVTGEAAQHAETRHGYGCPSDGETMTGPCAYCCSHGHVASVQPEPCKKCSPAPPAAGAPPAPAPSMPEPSPARAGYPYTEAGDAVMAQRFPAPVAPPAEAPALGVVTFDHEAQRVSYRPAPPAVAGGDALPEIQVGDVVVSDSYENTWRVESAHDAEWCAVNGGKILAIYRDPLWRRRQEGQ